METPAPGLPALDLNFLTGIEKEKTRTLIIHLLQEYKERLLKLSYEFNYSSGGIFYFPALLKVLQDYPFTINTFAVLTAVRNLQPAKASQITASLDLWHFNQTGKYLRWLREHKYITCHRLKYSLSIHGLTTLDKLARDYYNHITTINS